MRHTVGTPIELRGRRDLLVIIAALWCSSASGAGAVGDANVKECVQDIFAKSGGSCLSIVELESVTKIDGRTSSDEAFVIADVVLRFKQRIGGMSPAATACTGSGWHFETKNPYAPNTGAWLMYQSQADMDGGYIEQGQRLRIRKKFRFELWESGWRCAEAQLSPVDGAWIVDQPPASTAAPQQSSQQRGRSNNTTSPAVQVGTTAVPTTTQGGQPTGQSAIATFSCVSTDNRNSVVTIVVNYGSHTVRSQAFGGPNQDLNAKITDTTISWDLPGVQNHGGGFTDQNMSLNRTSGHLIASEYKYSNGHGKRRDLRVDFRSS